MAFHSDFRTSSVDAFPPFYEFCALSPSVVTHHTRLSVSHFFPQSAFLIDPDGCPFVNYIGHLESMEADFLYILHYLNARELWDGYAKYGIRGHVGNDPNQYGSKLRSASFVTFSEEMRHGIMRVFRDDFIHFGYPVPSNSTDGLLSLSRYSARVDPPRRRWTHLEEKEPKMKEKRRRKMTTAARAGGRLPTLLSPPPSPSPTHIPSSPPPPASLRSQIRSQMDAIRKSRQRGGGS
jgi:hypothetical protein